MADIFISYKSDRRAAAEHMAEILADHGYSVWWDYGLVSGNDFGAQIETQLRTAKAVIVLWCTLSRDSEWVKEEAGLAKRLGTLIPVTIEPVEIPLGFSMAQTIDLSHWDGAPTSSGLSRLLRDVKSFVGGSPVANAEGLERSERAWRRFGAPRLTDFPLIDEIERKRPARTLPSILAHGSAPAPAPAPVDPVATEPEKPAGTLPSWLPLAAGGTIAAGVAAFLMWPGGSPTPPDNRNTATTHAAAPSAAALPVARRDGPPNPEAESVYLRFTEAEAGKDPACFAARARWMAIKRFASITEIRAFQRDISQQCSALYNESANIRFKIIWDDDRKPGPPDYTDCASAKKDWAAFDKRADYLALGRLLNAIPYGLEGCLDMRAEISKAFTTAMERDTKDTNDLRARFD